MVATSDSIGSVADEVIVGSVMGFVMVVALSCPGMTENIKKAEKINMDRFFIFDWFYLQLNYCSNTKMGEIK